jgi:hypothetical protein
VEVYNVGFYWPTFVRNFMSLRKPSLVLAPKSSGFPWVKLELMFTLLIPKPRLGTKQPSYNNKKENNIFLIYKEIQMGSGAKSNMGKGFLIYEEMHKYFHHI